EHGFPFFAASTCSLTDHDLLKVNFLNAQFLKSSFHLIQIDRFYNGFYQLHFFSSLVCSILSLNCPTIVASVPYITFFFSNLWRRYIAHHFCHFFSFYIYVKHFMCPKKL